MRRRGMLLILACALILAAGCRAAEQPAEEGAYLLYFLAGGEGGHGPALEAQPWSPSQEDGPPEPEEVLRALLAGPTQEGLLSPFPRGVTLQSWEWDRERPGNLRVRLSEQYSGLTDISLTLADYAIVLTLAQIQGVESIEILTSSYSVNYRSHQLLTPEEAVLSDPLAGGNLS